MSCKHNGGSLSNLSTKTINMVNKYNPPRIRRPAGRDLTQEQKEQRGKEAKATGRHWSDTAVYRPEASRKENKKKKTRCIIM
jgi:hypothetical protein